MTRSHDAPTPVGGEFTGPLRGTGLPLEKAILTALDDAERALQLEPVGDGTFRAASEPDRFGHIFGGQLLGQAVLAASRTVEGQQPNSLHAYFVRSGQTEAPVDVVVERTRDGRSLSTRHVEVRQDGAAVLTAVASFHTNPEAPQTPAVLPAGPPPEELPLLQHWAQQAPPELQTFAQTWIDVPPPLELRMAEAPTFLGGAQAAGTRGHWMRLPRDIGDDPALHHALLAYASDYLFVDMAFRVHPDAVNYATAAGLSLDHAIWLHRPAQFDQWHLYVQEAVTIFGHRALVRGTIVDTAGAVVASTAQEVLIRPLRT